MFAALADNAKHNQQGRVDEHGTLRHRVVELCPVGAILMLIFSYFHIMGKPVPNFVPDFTTEGYGEYGYREWYDCHLFAGKEDIKKKMSYDSESLSPWLSPPLPDIYLRSPQTDHYHAQREQYRDYQGHTCW